jgi:serine/threonine protein kinase
MPADPQRVKELFMAVSEAPAAGRAAALDRECGGDAELRQRVEALLAVHERPDSFLNAPAGNGTAAYRPPDGLEPGQVFAGRFKLREELGEGGMGVVFVADQIEPVQRRVALKVIKAGADSARVLARFEQERQALALMDHPNIAKVFDAGVSDAGQPFFVMELIKGVPLTRYCDEARLTPRQRLELFIPVCQAVQHAHQKGVIHRDIKPSKILVGLYDGKPIPKVIDFGVAKATGPRIGEHSVYTEVGTVIGTLEYMSPEQAELNNLDIDTRTDVYALGVILYELLTGTVPLSRKELQSSGFAEMLRIIKEKEPPKPSTRLSASRELPSVAAVRHTEPAKLSRLIRGDLDWITMKALEKYRSRRYETANGFAMDIQRYLDDEPVLAGPPSAGYRLRKFLRKNRAAISTAAAFAVTLVIFAVLSVFFAIVSMNAEFAANRERDRAVQAEETALAAARAAAEQRQLAEANEQKALAAAAAERTARQTADAVVEFLEKNLFAAARPQGQDGGLGHDVTLRRAVEAALPAVQTAFKEQPLIEARLRLTLGVSFAELGDAKGAARQFEAARALYARRRGPDHNDTLIAMHNLANCYADLGREDDALRLREETLAIRKAKLGPDHPHTLLSMTTLANSYDARGRQADALKLREETLAIQRAKLGPDHPDTITSMHNLAAGFTALGRYAEAARLLEETLTAHKAKFGPDHPDTLKVMLDLANNYDMLGRQAAALAVREETLARSRAVLGPDHPFTAGCMGNLANSYHNLGRHDEALKLREETLALQKAKLGPDHPETLLAMHNLANSYSAVGRYADAVRLREETLALRRAKLGVDHPDTLMTMHNLANGYGHLGRRADALKLHEETLALRTAKLGPDHPDTLKSMYSLAADLHALGRYAEALKLAEETLALRKLKLGPDHPDTLLTVLPVADSLAKLNRAAEAIPVIDDCLRRAPGQAVDPSLIPRLATLRVRHFQNTKDAAGCRQTAEMWEKLNRTDAVSLYNAACWRAVTAAVVKESPGADAARLAAAEADRAMDWLRKAAAAGYKDAAHMKQDTDLDALRGREDFKKLLADLEAGPARPK